MLVVEMIEVAANKSVSALIERKTRRAPHTRNISGSIKNIEVKNENCISSFI